MQPTTLVAVVVVISNKHKLRLWAQFLPPTPLTPPHPILLVYGGDSTEADRMTSHLIAPRFGVCFSAASAQSSTHWDIDLSLSKVARSLDIGFGCGPLCPCLGFGRLLGLWASDHPAAGAGCELLLFHELWHVAFLLFFFFFAWLLHFLLLTFCYYLFLYCTMSK